MRRTLIIFGNILMVEERKRKKREEKNIAEITSIRHRSSAFEFGKKKFCKILKSHILR